MQYRYVIGLGPTCEVKGNLTRIMRQRGFLAGKTKHPCAPSGPFDWQITPEAAVLEYFRRDFAGMFERDDLVMDEAKGFVVNTRFATAHPHEFPKEGASRFERGYAAARSRHDYLCSNLRKVIRSPAPKLFVTSVPLSSDAQLEISDLVRSWSSRGGSYFMTPPLDFEHPDWLQTTPQRLPIWDEAFREVRISCSAAAWARFSLKRASREMRRWVPADRKAQPRAPAPGF